MCIYNMPSRVTLITLLISQSKHDVHNGLHENVQCQSIYNSTYSKMTRKYQARVIRQLCQ